MRKQIVIAAAIPDSGVFTMIDVVERLKALHPDDTERYLIARTRSFLTRKWEQDRVGFWKIKSQTYLRTKMMQADDGNLLITASTL